MNRLCDENPDEDPYEKCPHARSMIEQMLVKIAPAPFQGGLLWGEKNEEEYITTRRREMRWELIRQFILREKEELERAICKEGMTFEEIRRRFIFTALPRK